ncbi:Synaptonemal complex protein zep1 [Pleodorina starrii]|uniref:Zeaxanthin epoxidase, chloroplastic n=1 Tax=Pleodorina starrii TaxID=330485 RepID=A0A9W6BAY9_9CHLO|nr:Synaptonemal complex protein zep1 [Pleodorina starrii]GLC71719.1 Synaptonemal complex protein zep1 [Pleodorina starrii]
MMASALTSSSLCSSSGRAAAGHVIAPIVPTVPSRAPPCLHLLPSSTPTAVVTQQAARKTIVSCAAPRPNAASSVAQMVHQNSRPMKVIVAGAGIGGLVLAVALLKQGFEVQVFERDLTAIRGEGKYRGPIQVQSNALAALEAIDPEVAAEVLREGCITGDRVNGLCDGLTGEWYVKFDTFHPAVNKGLPVTRVISRVTLQQVLARAVERYGGPSIIQNGCCVTSFEERVKASGGTQVVVNLEDGREFTADVLIGADGIWSKIRRQLIGETKANYSGYTCYTGISDFTPADIDIVGYRVFLGNGQYFVSSDVGNGKMQWYGFHKESPGGTDQEGTRKARLLEIFGQWNDNVVDLIKATPEEDVLRRDIFDRPPIFTWAKGRVALLGDSAHAMQPNLGQGGCMAIEDAYELAIDLSKAVAARSGDAAAVDVGEVLRQYQANRLMRVSAIHGMAGMAAFMASTYKCYLGEGWSKWVESLRIPHPGRVIGRLVMLLTMPAVLDWVLGGNTDHVAPNRVSYCSLGDKPKAFAESRFGEFMADDASIVHASHADWLLVSERTAATGAAGGDANSSCECKGIYMGESALVGRSGSPASPALWVDDVHVHERHAQVWREGESGASSGSDGASSSGSGSSNGFFLKDLGTGRGTWVNGHRIADGSTVRLWPGDAVEFGRHPSHEVFKVKMQHVTLRSDELQGTRYNTLLVGKVREPKALVPEQQVAAEQAGFGGKLVAA